MNLKTNKNNKTKTKSNEVEYHVDNKQVHNRTHKTNKFNL